MALANATMSSGANPGHAESGPLERFEYDDTIVRMFMGVTLLWGVVGMLVGLIIALQLSIPQLNLFEYVTFGRLRPLHTNAVIFAFAGNAIFAAIYYSTQRLCKARMWSDKLSRLHFWGWQAIIVSAALSYPLGITQGKEYAELEWPIDLAIAVVWLGFFGGNFFMTLIKRRERHMYVALWFYIATIVTVTVLHVFNNLWLPYAVVELINGRTPTGTDWMKSWPVYAGVQDAFMQWWYGHNAVAFFLTTPFLGLMYYFMPKAAERPVYSYRLSIVHFWSLVFIYIWAGPHHLHYTALPAWASTLGMLFSLMLWMPSWGGMINGLLTLRGAWSKVTTDPILKFFVVGVTFYGMSTFEGPMLSVKSINSLTHYTDWIVAHVHGGALGWNGFLTFGMIYWLAPRLYQTQLFSKKLMAAHFWISTIGMVLYVLSLYAAGVTQGMMWRAFNSTGTLQFPDFIETVTVLRPMYWIRALGGALYLGGTILCAYNIYMTYRTRPATYARTVHEAPALGRTYHDGARATSRLSGNVEVGHSLDRFVQAVWHRVWERSPVKFTVWVVIAISVASLFEIIPTFLVRSNVPTITTVKPYTPLELIGRDIYVAEGCYTCHSQMIRPMWSETKRYGEYSKPGEFVYDRPFQWGSRRIGPDLAREGGKQSHDWHVRHFINPQAMNKDSLMPSYRHLLVKDLNFESIQGRVQAMAMLGVPYGEAVNDGVAVQMAHEQADKIEAELIAQGGMQYYVPDSSEPMGGDINSVDLMERENYRIRNKKVIALIAYMQRLGTDISKPAEEPAAGVSPDAVTEAKP
jgi:cytochrome c oxidase cbb3-type subunit I/II